KWRPFGAFCAALLFGFSTAFAYALQNVNAGSAATLFPALPYVLTIVAVAGLIGRSIPPAAVGRPYRKQERPAPSELARTGLGRRRNPEPPRRPRRQRAVSPLGPPV